MKERKYTFDNMVKSFGLTDASNMAFLFNNMDKDIELMLCPNSKLMSKHDAFNLWLEWFFTNFNFSGDLSFVLSLAEIQDWMQDTIDFNSLYRLVATGKESFHANSDYTYSWIFTKIVQDENRVPGIIIYKKQTK